METKITKGEWIIENKSAVYDRWRNLWFCIIINDKGEFIQKIYGATKEEAEHNAKLIAAAPDLLEALLNVENDDNSIPKAIWDLRNASIKKATE